MSLASPALRKEVYMQSNTSVPENLNVLDSLIRHRHLHSTLLGYRSYAHRVLSDRMVGSPEQVVEFLDSMENRCKGVFKKDMEILLKAKAYVEGTGSEIQPWDLPFYTNALKSQRQHKRWKDSGDYPGEDNEDELSQLSGYFTVDNSIDAMKFLVEKLFEIKMLEVEIPPEERWDIDIGSLETSGLRKFEFHHDEEGPLGTMYMDLVSLNVYSIHLFTPILNYLTYIIYPISNYQDSEGWEVRPCRSFHNSLW